MWTEILSSVGITAGMGVFYYGSYKLGWNVSKWQQIKALEKQIEELQEYNEDLTDEILKRKEHIEKLKNHKVKCGKKSP